MSPAQKGLVQTSWCTIMPNADGVALLFYHRLFATVPATRALFANVNVRLQSKKLIDALTAVVNSLDEFERVAPTLSALGKRHASYGVEDDHYDAVGAVLLWALEQTLADLWTNELKVAWTNAYATVAHAMREAARTSVPIIAEDQLDRPDQPYISNSQQED